MVTFLCHPYFKTALWELHRQACSPRIWISTEIIYRKQRSSWIKNAALKKHVWRDHCLTRSDTNPCITFVFALFGNTKLYQNTVCHVFNLLSLTWDLEVMMHDLSALINSEHELHDTSNNLQKSCDPECNFVKLKNGRKVWRQEWGRMEILREALSLSPSLVPWRRDNLQWEKSSRQNNSVILSVLPLSLPASKDIHPYPSSLGHESSGWTLQAPKASSHPEEKGQSGLWGNWDKFVSVFLSAGSRRKGQGSIIALLGWVNPFLRLSGVKP